MAYAAGVDVGSTQTKAVVVNEKGEIVGRSLLPTGANVVQAAEHAFKEALDSNNISESEVGFVVGTGYGRYRVEFGDTQITEIVCHARGAAHMFPDTETVLQTRTIVIAALVYVLPGQFTFWPSVMSGA